ncbi:hypothetical protein RJ639_041033 [Escallonia herrerae]|uniref:Hexosyltransferase n=1 Tax=Escallonia herrerae TaxID=1293975 RepID=A0AA88WH91_9ASTE|nr:hypothetical protein RJ639_041033 [Escallonia herrerae]
MSRSANFGALERNTPLITVKKHDILISYFFPELSPVISATSGGILDRAIEAEDKKHGDFLRLEHVEGYLELSFKTKIYFATAVALWDADFYVKVDDDVHRFSTERESEKLDCKIIIPPSVKSKPR